MTTWKPVVTHPDRYEVSDTGIVRAKARTITRGCCVFVSKPQRLKAVRGGRANNYLRVMLMGPRRHAYIHHLVAEAFIGPRPEGLKVCHRDDDGFNNRRDNIYYGDRGDNESDRWINTNKHKLARMEPAPF